MTRAILRIGAQVDSRAGVLKAHEALDKCEHIIEIHDPVDLGAALERMTIRHCQERGIKDGGS